MKKRSILPTILCFLLISCALVFAASRWSVVTESLEEPVPAREPELATETVPSRNTEAPTEPESPRTEADGFTDVSPDAWYRESVAYVSGKGLMNGVGENRFDPEGSVTRGMLVTILHRMTGAPEPAGGLSFADVPTGSYYEAAVRWASGAGVVNGYSDRQFGPEDNVTREQMATILYRYARTKGIDTGSLASLASFADQGRISPYAADAMAWANAAGLITGVSQTALDPQGLASRAQTATIITRFDRLPADDSGQAPASFTVTFQAEDGAILKTETVAAGASATPPAAPRKEGWSFAGWSGPYQAVTADTVLTAQYVRQTAPPASPSPSSSGQAPAAASGITVGTAEARSGDQGVALPVTIRDNPGILGMTLSVLYDQSALTLTDGENGSALSGVLSLTKPGRFEPQCRFVWDGQDLRPEQIADGVLLTLRFDVRADAAPGDYPVRLLCGSGDIVDNNLNELEIPITNGVVRVLP